MHIRLSLGPFGLRIITTSSPWASPNLWRDPKLPKFIHPVIQSSIHASIPASSHACIHSYMHPDGVHPAMEASNDCITKIEVQCYHYARGWRVGFGYTAPMLYMFMINRSRCCSLFTLPYLTFTLNINIIKH